MKRFLALALGGALLISQSAPISAANKSTAQRPPVRSVSIVPLPKELFELGSIPAAHRAGVPQGAVLREFERLSSIPQQEFETSQAYADRLTTAWKGSPLAPSTGILGFVVDTQLVGIEIRYDADAQRGSGANFG